jgi:uncharacterized repeat protein (TIGR04076 family)
MGEKVVLVVCNGNIHRSVIAEYCLKQALATRNLGEKLIVTSRGVQGTCGTNKLEYHNLRDYPQEWALSGPVLEELGIDISEDRGTPISLADVERAAVILAMDHKVLSDLPNSLLRQFSTYRDRMHLFLELEGRYEDVPDCYGLDNGELHRQTIELIHRVANANVDTLLKWVGAFELWDLRVTVVAIRGRPVCGLQVGDYFEVTESSSIRIPPSKHFCIYALSSVLSLLPAKQRSLDPNDWMTTDKLVVCPDPEEGLEMKIERIRKRIILKDDVT